MKKELNNVHFIRAIASLSVCFFHLFCGNENLFSNNNFFKRIFSYGYLGVEGFFILSGFIICYSLPNSFNYINFVIFIKKRLVRIEPPYIASILLVLSLNYLSAQITGKPNHFDLVNIIFHLAYLNNFGVGEYIIPVYWTLGIEFQFYLLIGILFPILKYKTILIICIGMFILISSINFSSSLSLITSYLSFFALGMVNYFYNCRNMISKIPFLILSLLLLVQISISFNIEVSIACLITILILQFWQYKNKYILFFSKISFSLYLTHVIIGGKVINLGLRFIDSDLSRYLLFLVALFVSIGFAYLFYLLLEKPTMSISKKIRYESA